MLNFKTNKLAPSARKVRGGYYTPKALADYMCQWAIRTRSERVVEPSCGDGSFVSAAASMLGKQGLITAVELVPDEIARAKENLRGTLAKTDWRCASFFDVAHGLLQGRRYDVALGNPPFIRFQYFDRDERDRAFDLARRFGYTPNGLANAWVTFVQLSAELLRDGGRLAMIVPAEILQVTYAAELRYRLPMLFDDVYIVAFDELVFPEIQQEVVLLLGEGRRRYAGTMGRLHTKQVANAEALTEGGKLVDTVSHLSERHTHDEMKWTALFLEDCEFETLRAHDADPGLRRLGDLADVDVGIVTGRNRFFVIDDSQAAELDTGAHTVDVVGRTSALKSIRFTKDDLLDYRASHPSKLLHLTGIDRSALPSQLETYIRLGEEQGVHQGYKCRIRNRWFDVPSVYAPDAMLFRQIHTMPLMVANLAGVTTTDTIHRVRVRAGVDVNRLCASMVNSLTCAWAEVGGRSYGGGVLELEPREAETLRVPFESAGDADADYVDARLRANEFERALDHVDEVVLRQGCGWSKKDLAHMRAAWQKLRARRHRRKHPRRQRPRTASVLPA